MSSAKIQRWIDLLATLLSHRLPVTFEELSRGVPAYDGKNKESAKRMFERDKKELKTFGIPIDSRGEEGDLDFRYVLRAGEFYLPYLLLTTPRGVSTPRKSRHNYRSLKSLAFDADELRAIADGAARARQLGNAPLAADINSAMRKLAFDLPMDTVQATDIPRVVPSRAGADRKTLELLGDAMHGRKRVLFDYHAQGNNSSTRRTVEPYGLFFLNAHWYLVARDVDRDALRNFRASRISAVKQVAPTRDLPEYEIPASFDLREHARSRHAWELGDNEVVEATVEFIGTSGAAVAAAALGEPVEGEALQRRFSVRRPDTFARWLISFAGEARPLAPPAIRAEFREQLEATRRVYDNDAKVKA
jgi:proteasome accessory factor B